ncbi:MAG: sigma-70 family RNA polymerase sigma factor [Chloroflexaceae bacterium]|nr:sigma-70 family RNA polymerase sigma factor [Chloroflexaceae bacterium]
MVTLLQSIYRDSMVADATDPLKTEAFEMALRTQLLDLLERLMSQIAHLNDQREWNLPEAQRRAWGINLMCYLPTALTDDDLSRHIVSSYNHLKRILSALVTPSGWQLSAEQQQAYLSNILPYVPFGSRDEQATRVVTFYHQEHLQVEALRDKTHPEHHEQWKTWFGEVLAILCRKNLVTWATRKDPSVLPDDLCQIALLEIVRSLPQYRYGSRLSTWVFPIITRSIQNTIDKPLLPTIPLGSETDECNQVPDETDERNQAPDIAGLAQDHLFRDTVREILQRHFDPRECHVWWLHVDGHSLRLIGKRIGATEWFVRTTITKIRELLRSPRYSHLWEQHEEQKTNATSRDDAEGSPDA